MLDDLVQTIDTLKARISAHRLYFSEGRNAEWRTRIGLIDPLLEALGWDVADPNAVEIEPHIGEGWADYALLDTNRNPVMLIEAKKLSDRDIDAALDQATMYLLGHNRRNNSKIIYCACTNSDRWEVVDVTKQEAVMKGTLDNNRSASKCALGFLGLWRRSLQDGSFDSAVEPLVEVDNNAASDPTPSQGSSAPSAASVDVAWTPLSEDFGTTGNPPPKAIKFSDGTEKPTKYWFEVLKQTALHLVEAKLLTPQNCQIKSSIVPGSTRYLFSPDGKHSNGTSFGFPSPLGDTGIIVETNVSALESVRQTRRLLEHLGQDASQVYLKLS